MDDAIYERVNRALRVNMERMRQQGARPFDHWAQFSKERVEFGFGYFDTNGNEWSYHQVLRKDPVHTLVRAADPLYAPGFLNMGIDP